MYVLIEDLHDGRMRELRREAAGQRLAARFARAEAGDRRTPFGLRGRFRIREPQTR